MAANIFWQVYRNLERDFLSIANMVHVDDGQLKMWMRGQLILLIVALDRRCLP